ncbi:MAG: 50S ribosomal protein L29 [bacterium]|nr:50S ribosomal protein L29 [bacterium]
MKLKEIKKLSAEEMKQAEIKLRQEVMTMRFDHAVGKLSDTAAPRKKRIALARVLTLLNNKAKS